MRTRNILLMFGLLFSTASLLFTIYNHKGERKFCGVLKYKIRETSFQKYSADVDPLFVMKFDGLPNPVNVYPTWNDFMELKEGTRLCYTLNLYQYDMYAYRLWTSALTGSIILFIVSGICILIYKK